MRIYTLPSGWVIDLDSVVAVSPVCTETSVMSSAEKYHRFANKFRRSTDPDTDVVTVTEVYQVHLSGGLDVITVDNKDLPRSRFLDVLANHS